MVMETEIAKKYLQVYLDEVISPKLQDAFETPISFNVESISDMPNGNQRTIKISSNPKVSDLDLANTIKNDIYTFLKMFPFDKMVLIYLE
jgi:hypothetical protein